MAEFTGNGKDVHLPEVRRRNGDRRAVVVSEEALPLLDSKPPAELGGKEEQTIYRQMVKAQEGTGVYRVTDRWLLSSVASRLAMAWKLKAEISRTPYHKADEHGRKAVRAGLREWRALLKDVESSLRELGFTPAAREKFMKDRSETMLNTKHLGYDIDGASED